MTDKPASHGGHPNAPICDRLVVALATPDIAAKAGYPPATVVAHHEPLVVLEWLGFGKGLVVLDGRNAPGAEIRANVQRILQAHDKGVLFVCVAGGDAPVVSELQAADAETRHRENVGLYHLGDDGKLRWAAGRRLRELEKAVRKLPDTAPLTESDLNALVELGRKERQEAATFVQGTSRRFPHLTVALIAICVLFYALTSGDDLRAHRLELLLANLPTGVRAGELWRLFTYALLHGSSTHLLVNMMSLYSLGAFLEPLLGRGRLAILSVVTAVAGGIASTLFTAAPSVGASGMVWGLIGATFGMLSKRRRIFPALIARSLRQRLVVVLGINVFLSFLPGIDRYCHFGGGIAGYLLAFVLLRQPDSADAS